MPSKKYFIAVVIPEPIGQKIEEIKHELFNEFGLKGALRSPAHITLHRPFEWKQEKENSLITTLNEFKSGPPFQLNFQNFNCFEPRVIYVDLAPSMQLGILHNNLTLFCKKNLRLFNEAEDKRGFHPHVTIAFRDLKKNKFTNVWQGFSDRSFSGDFRCDNFSLLRLESRWEVIHEFKF